MAMQQDAQLDMQFRELLPNTIFNKSSNDLSKRKKLREPKDFQENDTMSIISGSKISSVKIGDGQEYINELEKLQKRKRKTEMAINNEYEETCKTKEELAALKEIVAKMEKKICDSAISINKYERQKERTEEKIKITEFKIATLNFKTITRVIVKKAIDTFNRYYTQIQIPELERIVSHGMVRKDCESTEIVFFDYPYDDDIKRQDKLEKVCVYLNHGIRIVRNDIDMEEAKKYIPVNELMYGKHYNEEVNASYDFERDPKTWEKHGISKHPFREIQKMCLEMGYYLADVTDPQKFLAGVRRKSHIILFKKIADRQIPSIITNNPLPHGLNNIDGIKVKTKVKADVIILCPADTVMRDISRSEYLI